MSEIMKRLDEHIESAQEFIGDRYIFGAFVFGSQNYDLDDEQSDLDSKLLVLPSFKDVASLATPLSMTHERANGDHIDVRDVRLFIDNFKNQSHNSLEALFTPYCYVDPIYQEAWKALVKHREKIARLNPFKAVLAMEGMARRNYGLLFKPLQHNRDKFDTLGYNPKQLHHILKSEYFIDHYIRGDRYEDCIKPTAASKELIVMAKRGHFTKEQATEIAERSMERSTQMATNFGKLTFLAPDADVLNLIDAAKEEIIRKGFVESLLWEE